MLTALFQFLTFFSQISFPSLSDYDPELAWPLILDNFVEWLREKKKIWYLSAIWFSAPCNPWYVHSLNVLTIKFNGEILSTYKKKFALKSNKNIWYLTRKPILCYNLKIIAKCWFSIGVGVKLVYTDSACSFFSEQFIYYLCGFWNLCSNFNITICFVGSTPLSKRNCWITKLDGCLGLVYCNQQDILFFCWLSFLMWILNINFCYFYF